ncbi:MAG: hypothetical protein AAF196_00530 [Planctomycetota bacterium]
MAFDLATLAEITLLVLGFYAIDLLTRRDGMTKTLSALRIGTPTLQASLLIGLSLPLAFFWNWSSVPQGTAIATVALGLSFMLGWKAVTEDIDPVFGDHDPWCRPLVILSVIGLGFSPAFLIPTAFLFSTPYGLWEHHATLPMRLLLALSAFLGVQSLATGFGWRLGEEALLADISVLLWFLVTIQISHYLITALAKIWLGPKPWSWPVDNKMHHLGATAYSWGWGRWMSWDHWKKLVGALRRTEKPMQWFAFLVELLAPLALLHRDWAIAFCILWAGFHFGVVAVSGLFFWDWIGADLLIAAMLLQTPADLAAPVFGGIPLAIGALFLVAFPLRHKLFKPIPLGWWDTPFTQRMHWRVTGESGKVYGLYNDFMCPNERLYGKVHACFMAPRQGMTYHLGEVWKKELRDALRAAGPNPEKLEEVRAEFGCEPRCETRTQNHQNYLRRFFAELNDGAKKSPLPHALRWLKAPGDQLFYWGDLPRYRRQEPVTEVSLHYREEYFDGEKLVRIHDEDVVALPIDAEARSLDCVPEPTPREIDDLLLEHANGKIIDLPNFGSGYVEIDDGKARPNTQAN